MGNSAWETVDPDLQAFARTGGLRRVRWPRLLAWLVVILLLTLVAAYYVPIFRTHQDLVRDFTALSVRTRQLEERALASERALEKTRAEKAELLSEKQETQSKQAALERRASTLAEALREKLTKQKKNLYQVESEAQHVRVALADELVFEQKSFKPSRSGRQLVCGLAKELKRDAIQVSGIAANKEDLSPTLLKEYGDTWARSAARAASIAELMAKTCRVPAESLRATGLGTGAGSGQNEAITPGVLLELTLKSE